MPALAFLIVGIDPTKILNCKQITTARDVSAYTRFNELPINNLYHLRRFSFGEIKSAAGVAKRGNPSENIVWLCVRVAVGCFGCAIAHRPMGDVRQTPTRKHFVVALMLPRFIRRN